jgi:hypothetical protein
MKKKLISQEFLHEHNMCEVELALELNILRKEEHKNKGYGYLKSKQQ